MVEQNKEIKSPQINEQSPLPPARNSDFTTNIKLRVRAPRGNGFGSIRVPAAIFDALIYGWAALKSAQTKMTYEEQ